MCLRLNREESLIAGPSSGLALVGALKVIEDQPDAVVVVMFPDNVFKYASSFEKHFPQFRAARAEGEGSGEPSAKEQLMVTLVENSRNSHNTVEVEGLSALLSGGAAAPMIIDVRGADIYGEQHIAGAVNIPLTEMGERQSELPEDRGAAIVTVCNRGNMSISGMLFLQSLGYRRVTSLNGGTLAWADEGHPVASEGSGSGE
jgi:rhodanese-related sulfurtransferase